MNGWVKRIISAWMVFAISLILFLLFGPVPTWLIDMLLAASWVSGIWMCVVVVTQKERIWSLPTVLLGMAIFRVCLNIASSKLILSNGYAGQIIQSLGDNLASSSLGVACVVFFLLLVLQWFVINKGAERIAQVSARFALDALPGKQASIEADARAGLLWGHETLQEKEHLHKESAYLGAMDGAMKFVKGDALATLIIAVVNIVGGVAIGVTSRKLSFEKSLEQFLKLGLGDALSSQIPSLLLTVAAALSVSFVGSASRTQSLQQVMGKDIFASPEPFIYAAVVAVLAAVFMPPAPFLLLAVLMAGMGFWIKHALPKQGLTHGKNVEVVGTIPDIESKIKSLERSEPILGLHVKQHVSIGNIKTVLQSLAEEQVSTEPFHVLAESWVGLGSQVEVPTLLFGARRALLKEKMRDQKVLQCIRVDPMIEETLREGPTQSFKAELLERLESVPKGVAFVVNNDIRRAFFDLCRPEHVLQVYGIEELPDHLVVDTVAILS